MKCIKSSVFMLGMILCVAFVTASSLYAWNDFGRGRYQGYFDNRYFDGAGGAGLPVMDPGFQELANLSQIDRANTIANRLERELRSGSEHNKAGAAFIVNTMLERRAPGNGRNVLGDIGELRTRLVWMVQNGGEIKRYFYNRAGVVNTFYQTPYRDVAWYNGGIAAEVYEFWWPNPTTRQNELVYLLKENCANPLGDVTRNGIPPPSNQVSPDGFPTGVANGSSTVTVMRPDGGLRDTKTTYKLKGVQSEAVAEAYVGDAAWWKHTLGMSPGQSTEYDQWRGGGNELFREGQQDANGRRGRLAYPSNEEPQHFNRNYTFTSADVGKKFCGWTSWDQLSGIGWTGTDRACVIVKSNPDVYAAMDGSDSTIGILNIGATQSTPAYAFNLGYTPSREAPYTVREFVVPANQSLPDFASFFNQQPEPNPKGLRPFYREGDYGGSECDWLKQQFSMIQCRNSNTRSGTRVFGADETFRIGDLTIDSTNYSVGEKVCRFMSVRRFKNDIPDSLLRAGKPFCVTIAKSPKVQVLGGDLTVGRLYASSTAASRVVTSSMNTLLGTQQYSFGSWSEYGVIAPGDVKSVSGAAYATDTMRKGVSSVDGLTFANIPMKGSYGNVGTMPDIVRQIVTLYPNAVAPPSNSPNLNALTKPKNDTTHYETNNDLTLKGGVNLDQDSHLIIRSLGTVTIEGNISYTSAAIDSIDKLPQVVIIAQNIIIKSSVTQVDAWLIASGTISTCDTISSTAGKGGYADGLNAGMCDQKLTINGPIMAQQLQLRRTAGSSAQGMTAQDKSNSINSPAEVINLRPDTYLWAAGQAKTRSTIRTTYTRELPPRF